MTGTGAEQEWDAFPPGGYGPPSSEGTPQPYAAPPAYGAPQPYGPPQQFGPPGYGLQAYGPPPGYGPQAYGPPPGYGTPPGYGPQGYGPPPGYAPPPGYGPQPYGPHAYGRPPGWGWTPPDTRWPHGDDRPSVATAAAVLGFVTAGLTFIVCLFMLIDIASNSADAPSKLFLLGFGSAAGLVVGGVRLLQRRSPVVLFGSAVASVAILLITLLTGLVTLYPDQVPGLVVTVILALPLPLLTAIFSWQGRVRGWAEADPPRLLDPI